MTYKIDFENPHKFQEFEAPGSMYINFQNAAIFLKPTKIIDKIKIILYPSLNFFITGITIGGHAGGGDVVDPVHQGGVGGPVSLDGQHVVLVHHHGGVQAGV